MLEKVLNKIFPPACVLCGQLNEKWICNKCLKRVEISEKSEIIEVKNKNYEKIMYIFKYEKAIRKLMLQYKFYNCAYVSEFFAKAITKKEANIKFLKEYDMIIPIPMHKKKQSKRGYNQTILITDILSKTLNIPSYSKLLRKIVNTKTQSKLSGKSRQKNIKNAFVLENELIVEDKNIILFDDIFTTGATINECSRILKQAGANKILALTIAKD